MSRIKDWDRSVQGCMIAHLDVLPVTSAFGFIAANHYGAQRAVNWTDGEAKA